MAIYVPRLYSKSGYSEVAYTEAQGLRLLREGYTAGALAPDPNRREIPATLADIDTDNALESGMFAPLAAAWRPLTVYKQSQLVTSGGLIYSANADHTSGTPTITLANWTAVGGATTTNTVPRWAPTTAYTAGQQVISPDNNVVSRATAGTSGATYNSTKWIQSFTSARRAEAWVDWTTKTDGTPTVMDSGHVLQLDKNGNTNSNYQIISGKLTNTAVNAAATAYSYATPTLSGNVQRVGGQFSLAAGGTNGGAILIIWHTIPGSNGVFPANVVDAACHLQLFSDRWRYGVFNSNVLTDIATGTFATPLAANTTLRVEVYHVGNTAYIFLPDGSWASVTDSRISSNAGAFPCWEVGQANAATDAKPSWLTGWATSGVDYRDGINALQQVMPAIKPVDATNVETGLGAWARAGSRNTASGIASAVTAGTDNLANQKYATAQGFQAKTLAPGDTARACGMFAAQGDAQTHTLTMRGQTTDATPKMLGTSGESTGFAGQVSLGAFRTHRIRAEIAATNLNGTYLGGGITLVGTVHRGSGSPTMVASTVVVTKDDLIPVAWTATILSDTTNNLWTIQVTGEAAKNINWVAAITFAECG